MTLHEAIAVVLREGCKTKREIADEINRRKLYQKGDGTPVESGQISARVNRYRKWFEQEGLLQLIKSNR